MRLAAGCIVVLRMCIGKAGARIIFRWGDNEYILERKISAGHERSSLLANQIIQIGTAQIHITPYYMATLACDILGAAQTGSSNSKRPWFKYLLYCIAIELALKAILLNNNNAPDRKKLNKAIGHDLVALRTEAAPRLPDDFFDDAEVQAIESISPFFASKSIEYISGSLLAQMMTGGKDLPEITDLEAVAEKVLDYVKEQKHFIGSDTTT
jgi:hypothetical protein